MALTRLLREPRFVRSLIFPPGRALDGVRAVSKPYWKSCSRGKLLRAVVKEALPDNVVIITRASEQEARIRLIDAGKAYCERRCGGCPLTKGYVPPDRI